MSCTYCEARKSAKESTLATSLASTKCKICTRTYCEDHTHSCCVNDSHTYCPICFGRRDLIEMCHMCDRPYCRKVCGVNNVCSICIKWSKDE